MAKMGDKDFDDIDIHSASNAKENIYGTCTQSCKFYVRLIGRVLQSGIHVLLKKDIFV